METQVNITDDNNENSTTISNEETNDYGNVDFTYTYKLEEGVSKVKGGLKVLKDLKYPSSILRLF